MTLAAIVFTVAVVFGSLVLWVVFIRWAAAAPATPPIQTHPCPIGGCVGSTSTTSIQIGTPVTATRITPTPAPVTVPAVVVTG